MIQGFSAIAKNKEDIMNLVKIMMKYSDIACFKKFNFNKLEKRFNNIIN